MRLENHTQVVKRISQAGLELSLLVTDRQCEEYHENRGIIVTGDLPHVVSSRKIFYSQSIIEKLFYLQVEIRNSSVGDDINKTVVTVNCDNYEAPTKDIVVDVNNNNEDDMKTHENMFHLNIPIQSSDGVDDDITQPNLNDESPAEVISDKKDDDILVHLAKTAAEMREIIMRRKKKDPRKEKRKDLKRRVEMIEEL